MMTIEALRDYGANVEEGLNRCMNNEAFYLRLVNMAIDDPNFVRLHETVRAGDLKAAFEAAHSLKGVLGNLSLTPLYAPVAEMTEELRAGAAADYDAYL
ncbi:MAG: Hpt domain-containing protein, partial [Oscillospiraceae bacterium]|nr:Hpt domain-containing protein [Oscillospiraceae bacterium]